LYGKPVSLDTEYDSGESDDTSTVLDYLGKVDPRLEALPNRLNLAQAFGYLDEREKAIIFMYYYKGLSQTEIAKKLALSQMHVSRLQCSALDKLSRRLLESWDTRLQYQFQGESRKVCVNQHVVLTPVSVKDGSLLHKIREVLDH